MQLRPLAALPLIALLVLTARPAAAEDWTLDPAHTSAVFKIDHLGVSEVYGMFKQASGTFTTGEEAVSFDIAIATGSIDTGNDQRDEHLKGPDFFDVEQFPEMTFVSTGSQDTDDGYHVTGDLTIYGVTHEITVDMEQGETLEMPPGTTRTGFTTTFTINRSDYGMDYGIGMVGDAVTIMLGFEGTR